PRGDVPDDEAPQPPRHADDRIAPRAPDAGTAVRVEPLLPEEAVHAERGGETRETVEREHALSLEVRDDDLRRRAPTVHERVQLEELRRMAATLGDVLPIDLLPEPDRLELVSHMAVRKFKQDEVVYHQGDPAEHAYVVFEGLVKVLLLDEQGHELLVSIMRRGEFFGELALFEKAPRDGTAMAIIPTTALQIERDGALRVLRRNPEASRFMFERLSRTIRTLEVK